MPSGGGHSPPVGECVGPTSASGLFLRAFPTHAHTHTHTHTLKIVVTATRDLTHVKSKALSPCTQLAPIEAWAPQSQVKVVSTQNFASKLSNLSRPTRPPRQIQQTIRPPGIPVKVCDAVERCAFLHLPRKHYILTCFLLADGFRQEARPYRQEAYVLSGLAPHPVRPRPLGEAGSSLAWRRTMGRWDLERN